MTKMMNKMNGVLKNPNEEWVMILAGWLWKLRNFVHLTIKNETK